MFRVQKLLHHCICLNGSTPTQIRCESTSTEFIHFWLRPTVDDNDTNHKATKSLHRTIRQNDSFQNEVKCDRNELLLNIQQYRNSNVYGTTEIMSIFVLWTETAFKYSPTFIKWPNAMCLSTIDSEGGPSARFVLLKSIELNRGQFIFFTNYQSQKALEIADSNQVSITFYWDILDLSVRIKGTAHRVSQDLSDRYWSVRPKASKISQITSDQSMTMESKRDLERKYEQIERQYGGMKSEVIPRPQNWGGYAVTAERVEFWNGNDIRFHDRTVFTKQRNGDKWSVTRLQP